MPASSHQDYDPVPSAAAVDDMHDLDVATLFDIPTPPLPEDMNEIAVDDIRDLEVVALFDVPTPPLPLENMHEIAELFDAPTPSLNSEEAIAEPLPTHVPVPSTPLSIPSSSSFSSVDSNSSLVAEPVLKAVRREGAYYTYRG